MKNLKGVTFKRSEKQIVRKQIYFLKQKIKNQILIKRRLCFSNFLYLFFLRKNQIDLTNLKEIQVNN